MSFLSSSPSFSGVSWPFGLCRLNAKDIMRTSLLAETVLPVEDVVKNQELLHKILNRTVVVVGSEWTKKEIYFLELKTSGLQVVVSDKADLRKYEGNITVTCYEDHQLSNEQLAGRYPWVSYLDWIDRTASKSLRRSRLVRPSSKEREKGEEAEHFLRALLDLGMNAGYTNILDALIAATRGKIPVDVASCLDYGAKVYVHLSLVADELVQRATYLRVGRFSACLVFGGGQPDMPLLQIAADQADMAINVDMGFGGFRITFYTHNPAYVDLGFVEQPPLCGCGTAELKAAVISRWFGDVKEFIGLLPNARMMSTEQERGWVVGLQRRRHTNA